MSKTENPHDSDGGTAAGKEEMQKGQGKKRGPKAKNALTATAEAGPEMMPEEMLKIANSYFEKVEQRIRQMEQQTAILEKVATGLADAIEGLVLMTEQGQEE